MSKSANVKDLFKSAQRDGTMSKDTAEAITLVDPGQQIQNALGTPVDDVEASEVVLVTQLIDDSGSIRFSGNSEAMRDGHNDVLDALSGSKQEDSILAHTRYLHGKVLFPYRPLIQAVKMDNHNYNPSGETPLFDQSIIILGTVLAKTQEFLNSGVPVRTVTLISTDGAENASVKARTPDIVKKVVDCMLSQERHIIAGLGIDDGVTDFSEVFMSMGIREDWILTCDNTAHDIRAKFALFSKSAVRASQSAASFSKTAMGGFGTD